MTIEESQNKKETAREICEKLFPPTMNETLEWHSVAVKLLLFSGDTEAATEYAKKALENEPAYADRWALRSMEYLADPSLENEQQLAAMVGPFSVPQAYIEPIFGMQAFAEGNRSKAIAHFEKSVATGKIDWFSPCIADAMLRRMKSSKAWPSWIESKDEPERP